MKSAVLKKSAAAAVLLLGSVAAQAAGVTVTVSCGTVGQDFDFCKKAADEWSTKTGNSVKHLTIPQSTSDILGLFRQMFAAKSSDVDVITVDTVWPGIIKQHLLDLKPTGTTPLNSPLAKNQAPSWLVFPLSSDLKAAALAPAPKAATISTSTAAPAPPKTRDAAFFNEQAQRLDGLKSLRDKNLITEAEYQQKRGEILQGL